MTPTEILDGCNHVVTTFVVPEGQTTPPCRACAEAAITAAVAEEREACRRIIDDSIETCCRIIGDSITALRHAIGNNGLSGSPTGGLETALEVVKHIYNNISGRNNKEAK